MTIKTAILARYPRRLLSLFFILTALQGCGEKETISSTLADTQSDARSDVGNLVDMKEKPIIDKFKDEDFPNIIESLNFPSQINLKWEDDLSLGETSYDLYRDSGEGFKKILQTRLRSFRDTGLVDEKAYSYRITYKKDGQFYPLAALSTTTTKRRIKLQIYENSGNDVSSYPVQVFVPLPYGVYKQNESVLRDTFVVKDGAGTIVPAQFWVRSRWYAKDNSIKEMVVIFHVTDLPANAGKSKNGPAAVEYFLEHGATPMPDVPVSAVETSDTIEISNGNLTFQINKKQFNFIDKATYKGTEMINNKPTDGAYLVNRFDETYLESQPCTTKTPTVFSIEENGPIRVRIRVERPAHFITHSSDGCYRPFGSQLKEPVPGFVVWFDLYNNSHQIEVNYNMLNNAITAFDPSTSTKGEALDGWILFFQEMGITFSLKTPNNKFSYSADGTDVDLNQNINHIIQEDATTLSLNNVVSQGQGSSISAFSDEVGKGVSLIDPYFKYTSPNGWVINKANNQISILMSPEGCTKCESSKGFGDTGRNSASHQKSGQSEFLPSNSGLYALNDLSLLPKKFFIKFFEDRSSIHATLLENPPNIVLSMNDYNALDSATDLFGIRSPLVAQSSDSGRDLDKFEPNQHHFGVDMNRIRSCTTGGIAPATFHHFMQRPPQLNYLAVEVYDDLLRPQVLPKYWSGAETIQPYSSRKAMNPDILTDSRTKLGYETAAFNTLSYCKSMPIRSFDLGGEAPRDFVIDGVNYIIGAKKAYAYFVGKEFPPSFGFVITGDTSTGFYVNRSPSPFPRDDAHMWMQKLYDAPVDNPMLEYFKRRHESYLNTYTKHEYSGGSARGIGHALIAQVDSFLESGKDETLEGINEVMDMILSRMQDSGTTHLHPVSGLSEKAYAISFMEGYLMHAIINVLMVVEKGSDIHKKAYSLLFGGGIYRAGLPGLVDASLTTHFGYKDVTECATNPLTEGRDERCLPSSSGSAVFVDPLLTAAYILIDDDPERAKAVVSHLKKYLHGELGKGPAKVNRFEKVEDYIWTGDSINRSAHILNAMDANSVQRWLDYLEHLEGALIH